MSPLTDFSDREMAFNMLLLAAAVEAYGLDALAARLEGCRQRERELKRQQDHASATIARFRAAMRHARGMA